ncbi:glycosyltransferase family 4 protein [Cellulophaga sp. HaHaR_3_176]|uniref:glycosyltransferase family 4 protein n=1 Tax=Cellulophaga sp. HaHaR_3_176 TaxID=1942464 RepID=UPI001C1F50BB|nr:glycosyltransferase family 4 protein [Cellulophaga sp. HaHaR_3_176]QWX83323.1 glycosyltransferase family 4 protein [Cellulophaga sp. HaHaR_3_176]
MKVTQITPARFHHFHLARQMEKQGLLEKIYTGYPRFKLKDEQGIPTNKISTFPWLQAPFMKRSLLGLDKLEKLNKEWIWQRVELLDKFVAKKIDKSGVLIALSSNGLHSGKKMQSLGGKYICDRGSSHVVFQNDLLTEEYERWGLKWKGTDPRIIEKEQLEYEQADYITIASEFVKNSFIEKGVPEKKLIKIPYGARLDRFKKTGEPSKDKFSVLWVGQVSLRKGFMYALEAFRLLKHPNKEFIVIGHVSQEIKTLIEKANLNNITFKGNVPNADLLNYYSYSSVFIFPSIEDGFGMVMAEALACGCPVIASKNTGAFDLIENEKEGFIVPIRNPKSILDCFQKLVDTPNLREIMSENALIKVRTIGGWDTYGNNFKNFIDSIIP